MKTKKNIEGEVRRWSVSLIKRVYHGFFFFSMIYLIIESGGGWGRAKLFLLLIPFYDITTLCCILLFTALENPGNVVNNKSIRKYIHTRIYLKSGRKQSLLNIICQI